MRLDDELGWRCIANDARSEVVADAGGRPRAIRYTTGPHGFRAFGDTRSNRPRLLVLGDSFTQAVAVSDDETYYALLGKRLGVEVFAYGAGGYGTLQEYMILDECVDELRPDVILWQFCTNDFINNDYELEYASQWDNNAMRRPYLEADGVVRRRFPKPAAALRASGETVRLLWAMFFCWDRIAAHWAPTVETEIAAQGESHPGFARSVAITEELLWRVQSRAGNRPLLLFSADGREPYYETAARIARGAGFTFIDDVPEALHAAREGSAVVLADDRAHWNDLGHRICAAALEPSVRRSLEGVAERPVEPRERDRP
jgi:lysophospholipase L1-like esterase